MSKEKAKFLIKRRAQGQTEVIAIRRCDSIIEVGSASELMLNLRGSGEDSIVYDKSAHYEIDRLINTRQQED